MRTTRNAAGLIAKMVATGAVLTAVSVIAPDVYHDMSYKALARHIATDSVTTSATPDVYHDM